LLRGLSEGDTGAGGTVVEADEGCGGEVEMIVLNRIRCKKCDDVITSASVHDFKFCKCGECAVDGGKEYLRRIGDPENIEEMSVEEE
jgi:hypothetical protein